MCGRGDVVLIRLEGATANYLRIAGNLKGRLVARIRLIVIGAPLPYVAGHIEDAEGARGEGRQVGSRSFRRMAAAYADYLNSTATRLPERLDSLMAAIITATR